MERKINFNTANFMQFALSQGYSIDKILKEPAAIGKNMNIDLGTDVLPTIEFLNSPAVRDKINLISAEAQEFVREVVKDGRFILDWKDKPREVANSIGLTISPEAENEITNFNIEDLLDRRPDQLRGLGLVSFAIAVIVAAADVIDDELPIIDFSKIEKL